MSKLRQPFFLYLIVVSLSGLVLIVFGMLQLPIYRANLVDFFIFLALAILAQLATTSAQVGAKSGITYSVVPAVSLATVPFFGPAAATLFEAASNISIWLLKPADEKTWKRNWQQLAFNTGMSAIAIFAAGWVLLITRDLLSFDMILSGTVPWLAAAIVYDQTNLWLLIGILRLQHGKEFDPIQLWRENTWAIPIMIAVTSIGGGVLAFSLQQFGLPGLLIFFLPIFLSTYAFRLYVRQMQGHMDNLEAIVAERTKELESLNRQKDQFLAILTHDMKTPLTTIDLTASLLRENPQVVVTKPHYLDVIVRSEKALTDIVNNILDLEKLEDGSLFPIYKESFDLGKLITDTCALFDTQAQHKNICLETSGVDESVMFNGDLKQIERVLNNLISNALKYTPKEGKVQVSLAQNGHAVILDITDTGYGIPENEIDHIFDRFHRVEKLKGVASGTGLGLAITRALVDAHDGKIDVTSEEGKGSKFTVTLPQ